MFPAPTTPTDSYGFWLAKADGTDARNFLTYKLPTTLPDPQAKKIVATYQMDEGATHPGYLVKDVRKIDLSHYEFSIRLDALTPTEMLWVADLYNNERQVLLSWKSGLNVLAVFAEDGCTPGYYPLNHRSAGYVDLKFLLNGATSTTFTLIVDEES